MLINNDIYYIGKLKILYRYSTVSKRVNLKNLKSEIWEWVDQSCSSKEDTENVNPNLKDNQSLDKKRRSMEKSQTASFQNMISNLAVNQQNKEGQEVSVSYYFICLLHLANEKVNHNFIKNFQNFF